MKDETHAPQNLKTKVYRHNGKVKIKIEFEVEEDKKYFDKDEMKARLDRTTPWMLEHLYSWADFDQCYSINLFQESLYYLGKGLLRWDNCISSTKNGRRCLAAAKMLERAYNSCMTEDKSYENWSDRHKLRWVPLKNGMSRMARDQLCDNAMGMDREEYSSKMWEVIHERTKKIEAVRKKEVWEFIHKYIEYFWD